MNRLLLIVCAIITMILLSCKKDDSTPVDPNQGKPVVAILSPSDSSVIFDNVVVEIQATDDEEITRVEIFIDNQLDTNHILTSSPYRFTWDVSLLPDSSSHTLYAKAYDNDGKEATSSTFTVVVLRFAPTNLRVALLDDQKIKLQWNDNCNFESAFEIEASVNGITFLPVDTVQSNITQVTLYGTYLVDIPYYFRVRANVDTIHSKYSNVLTAILELLPPGNLVVTSLSDILVGLAWTDRTEFETGFEIQQSDDGINYTTVASVGANVTTASLAGTYAHGETYYFRARAVSASNVSNYSNRVKMYEATTLFAGGDFTALDNMDINRIAEWNGTRWSSLEDGLDGNVYAMTSYLGDLYVGGNFLMAGNVAASRIARWDGASWTSVGDGTNGRVQALAVYQNALYAAGAFTNAGGVSVNNIAKWDGASWSPVGDGLDGAVNVLLTSGGSLYAGGNFIASGNDTLNRLARWDGSSWNNLGNGVDGEVHALYVFFSNLIVGGAFLHADTVEVNRLTRWDGSSYGSFDDGFNGAVYSIGYFSNLMFVGGSLCFFRNNAN